MEKIFRVLKGENELTKAKFFEELNSFNSTRDLENKLKTLLREANLDEMKDSTEEIVVSSLHSKKLLRRTPKYNPRVLY